MPCSMPMVGGRYYGGRSDNFGPGTQAIVRRWNDIYPSYEGACFTGVPTQLIPTFALIVKGTTERFPKRQDPGTRNQTFVNRS